jgi:hypothetical protein
MLRIGVAQVEFTPPPGLPLMGNFRDDYLARGVHDPLCAKAVVFEDDRGVKAALLALDLCMVDRKNVELIRRVVGASSRVPPENVLVHATHTHSGPAPVARFLFGLDYAPFVGAAEEFLMRAAMAVADAERDLAEGSLAVGYSQEDRVSFNRRLRRLDGSTQMNWEALAPGFDPTKVAGCWGPTDPRVAAVAIQREDRAVAAMVNFGLHPAILAGDNWLYSADYPGALAEGLARIQGEPFTTLFLNGCCGNVNHVDYRDASQGRGFGMVQRVGYMLAAAATEALRGRTAVAGQQVAVCRRKVTLDRMPISAEEKRRCEKVLADLAAQPIKGQVDGLPEGHFADTRLAMHRVQDQPDEVEVFALRVGDLAIVGLPGEIFCELGLEIRRRSPAPHTLVVELSNDAIGYIPTGESFGHGGYEVTVGSTFYKPGAGEQLVASAVSQLQELFA